MTRPRVLFLTCHLPFPPVSGGRRREYELLRRIGADVDVHLAVISKTYDEDLSNAHVFDDFCRRVTIFPAEPEPDLAADPSPSEPYQVLRHRSERGQRHLPGLMRPEMCDLVHVEAFYLMQHVPSDLRVPLFLQEQNIEFDLWRQRTSTAVGKAERRVALAQYLRTLEAEIAAWRRSDLCGAVTVEDKKTMKRAVAELDVRLVPDGVDHLASEVPAADPHKPIGHEAVPVAALVANFGYQPNVDAALHLCREIWPLVQQRVPTARLLLVGNSPPQEILAAARRNKSIVVTGRVKSVQPFLDAADVVVCPLRIGGGIKVKVLEAMFRGKPIVTTSIGIQGLGSGVEQVLVVEDHLLRFADAVARLFRDGTERARLSEAARTFSSKLPSWDDAAGALTEAYFDLLGTKEQVPARARTAVSSRDDVNSYSLRDREVLE